MNNVEHQFLMDFLVQIRMRDPKRNKRRIAAQIRYESSFSATKAVASTDETTLEGCIVPIRF